MVERVRNYAKGGMVEQVQQALHREKMLGGGEPVLAALTKGEYVIPKNPSENDIMKMYANVPMARNLKMENYANGGLVGQKSNLSSNISTNNSRVDNRDSSFVSNIYVTSQDATSFRKTKYQIETEENARLARAARRY